MTLPCLCCHMKYRTRDQPKQQEEQPKAETNDELRRPGLIHRPVDRTCEKGTEDVSHD